MFRRIGRDEKTYRKLYNEEELSSREIADLLDVSKPTVLRDMEEFGIKREATDRPDAKYRDEAWLREKYVKERLTQYEIADLCDTDQAVISKWLGRFGIVGRNSFHKPTGPVPIHTDEHSGYVLWRDRRGGDLDLVKVHRLLAVAEYGFGEVAGNVIHHRNGIPWDNRAENIEPMPRGEHTRLHNLKEGFSHV